MIAPCRADYPANQLKFVYKSRILYPEEYDQLSIK
jgi:hypothetical protein